MKTPVNQCLFSNHKNIIFLILIYAILQISCAEIAPPPGGEEDKTKPFLISSEPANGSVNVPVGNSIKLFFSEEVIEAPGRSIFISPRPLKEPKIKWGKEKVEIIFADSFKVNETYIISLSSGISDLRKNKLDSTGIIAFSTGSTLDTGKVSGTVFQNGNPRGGLFVALYDEQFLNDTISYDSLYPSYYSQTNAEGKFSFEYLPPKMFRLIAFEDKNRDEFFNQEREPFALSDRPIMVGGNFDIENLSLNLINQDTTKPEIISASVTSDNLLKIRLSKPIDIKTIAKSPELVTLISASDTSIIYNCKSLLEEAVSPVANIILYPGKINEGIYNIKMVYDTLMPSIMFDNIIVKATEDKTPPSILSFKPARSPVILDSLEVILKFSEPLKKDAITNTTFIIETGKDTLDDIQTSWLDDFRLKINSPSFSNGQRYKLILTEFELMDFAGQVVGDSLREYKFSTIDSDSLGSISGEVNINIQNKKDDPVVLTLTNINKNTDYKLKITDHRFKIDVISGSYIISALIDSDNNNQFTNGSVNPFKYAETIVNFPDTIKVRARFETTGITLDIK